MTMPTDPDQIRAEIGRTQQELNADVSALTEKLSPPRILHRRVRRTRSALTSVRDSIMGSSAHGAAGTWETATSGASGAGETISSAASAARDNVAGAASAAADAAHSAPDRARRRAEGNPLAAGLIAFGAGWLLSSLLPASAPEQRMAAQVKDVAAEKAQPLAEDLRQAGQQVAGQLRESAQQHAEAVKQTATGAASTVGEEAQSAASQVTGHAQEATSRVTEQARPSRG
jgi:Protein of unknown function (DUF3618)